ncbi:hypothetical protein IV203_026554 [Nitzschia inconspicua]|uniref:Uncharacterized protein n=1 Tax=Nitzschia inconspicua TaxID=303405 RepID=A0A9K3Q023_9STRA|nr:hypothetical protein IV203_026554 [Nitzschia inconspicua]
MIAKEQSPLDDNYSSNPQAVVSDSSRNIPSNEATPAGSAPTLSLDWDEDSGRIDITQHVPDDKKHLVTPAGIGGAVVGLVLGGPVGSALLGFGSAYAVRKENCAGNAARALGELTLSVRKKAVEIEDEHQYCQRSVSAINKQCEKTQNSAVYKTKEFVASSWKKVEEYTRRHQILERGVEGTGKGVEYVVNAITLNKKNKEINDVSSEFHRRASNESFNHSKVSTAANE